MKTSKLITHVFLLGILFSTLIFSPFILDFTLTPRLISISLVVLICLFLLFRAKELVYAKVDLILFSYVAYVVFCCLSIFWSNTRSEAVFESSKLLISLFVFLFSIYLFSKNKDHTLDVLCKLSILIFIVEFLFVLYQLDQVNSLNKENLYAVYGLNSHKNLLSSFLFLNLFFLFLGLLRFQKMWKWLALICLVLNFGLIILIQTKAVWTGILVSLVFMLLVLIYKRIKIKLNFKISLIVVLILINIFFVFFLPMIIKRGIEFNTEQKSEKTLNNKTELDNERLVLWDKTYSMIKKNTFAGVGMGNWQIHFPDETLTGVWRAEDLNYTFQRPHNDFLWIFSETGILGLNLFLLFLFSIILLLINTIKNTTNNKSLTIQLFLCCFIIIGFFTGSFFDFPKERIELLIWSNIILAYAYFLINENNSTYEIFKIEIKSIHFYLLFISCIIVFAIGVYRYNGEFHTRKMYDRKNEKNNLLLIKEARKALSFAYKIDPTSVPINWYIGNADAALGNFIEAKKGLMNALNENPFNRNVLNDLGSACFSIGEIESAKKYYYEAMRISPRFDDAKLNLAALYINQKQFKTADSCLKTILHDSDRRTNYQKMVNAFLGRSF